MNDDKARVRINPLYFITHEVSTGMPLSFSKILLRLGLLVGLVLAVGILVVSSVVPQNLKAEDIEGDQVRIAIVEDESAPGEFMVDYIQDLPHAKTGIVDWYFTCQPLLDQMAVGVRYHAYVVDTLSKIIGGHQGPDCAAAIRMIDPTAYIIGNSSDPDMRSQWKDIANEFIRKDHLRYVFDRLLGKP